MKIVLFFIGLNLAIINIFSQPKLENNNIIVYFDDTSYRFSVRKKSYDVKKKKSFAILYDELWPPTTYASVKIDRRTFKYGSEYGNLLGYEIKNNTIISKWKIRKINVVQKLEIVKGRYTESFDSLRISYYCENKDNISHRVGIRLMLDTFLANNDGAPYRVAGKGNITEETIFYGNEIPFSWYCLDNFEKPDFIIQGILRGAGLVPPDTILFSNYYQLKNFTWMPPTNDKLNKFADDTGIADLVKGYKSKVQKVDSALAIFWFGNILEYNESESFSTELGLLNPIQVSKPELTALLNIEAELLSKDFPVFLDVKNKSPVVITNLKIKCSFQNDFAFTQNPIMFVNKIMPAEETTIQWHSYLLNDKPGIYNVKVTISDQHTISNIIQKSVKIPEKFIADVNFFSDRNIISPNNDGLFDILNIKIHDRQNMNYKNYLIDIYSDTSVKQIGGNGKLPAKIKWNAMVGSEPVKDGIYHIRAFLTFRDLIATVEASNLSLIVDTTPPIIELSTNISDTTERKLKIRMLDENGINNGRIEYFDNNGVITKIQILSNKENHVELHRSKFRIIAMDIAGNQSVYYCSTNISPLSLYSKDNDLFINFSTMYFDVNSAELKPGLKIELDKVAELLKKYKKNRIRVEGHTDNKGDDKYNFKLSKERAKSIATYLKRVCKIKNHIDIIGYGSRKPVADNSTEIGRAKNRRVVIVIEK